MRIDILGVQAFVAIAELGSFRTAAGRLAIGQAALSRRLQKLEEELGLLLMTRTTRSVTLTRDGADFLPKAQQLLRGLEESLGELRERARPAPELIRIGVLPTVALHYLPSILAGFARHAPAVRIQVHDLSATEIRELVLRGEAEFGLTLVAATPWDLETEPLLTEPMVLVCPRDHPLVAKGRATWTDIEAEPLVAIAPQSGNRMLIDAATARHGRPLRWQYEVHHMVTALGLVAAGVGLTILPQLAVDTHAMPGLAALPLDRPGITRTLGIIRRRGSPLSPAAERLRAMIVTDLGRRTAAERPAVSRRRRQP